MGNVEKISERRLKNREAEKGPLANAFYTGLISTLCSSLCSNNNHTNAWLNLNVITRCKAGLYLAMFQLARVFINQYFQTVVVSGQ